jgi:hypothetical protein
MGLVDRSFAPGHCQSFHKFMQQDDYGKTLFTVNDDETCAYVGVKTAAQLIGTPSIYSEAEYARFVRSSVGYQPRDLDGITSKALTTKAITVCSFQTPNTT